MIFFRSITLCILLTAAISFATANAEPIPAETAPPVPEKAAQMEEASIAVLRTIDKLSARTHTFEIPVEKTVKFGKSLFIKARACRKASPLEQPENAAFLQIWERKPDEEDAKWVFSGWMFSSNPSLSAIDHSVYDVWVIDCKNAATSAKAQTFSSETEPEATPTTEETPATADTAAEAPTTEEETEERPEEETAPESKPADPAPKLEEMPSSFEEAED